MGHISSYGNVIGTQEFDPADYFGTDPFANLDFMVEVKEFQKSIQKNTATSPNLIVTSQMHPKQLLSKISFNLIWVSMWLVVSVIAYAFLLFPPNPYKPENPTTKST